MIISSFDQFKQQAKEKGPKKMAVLAPEDDEFMSAVKESWELGYIEPVLLGDLKKMEQTAAKIGFDISPFEKIIETDRQAVADTGIGMLFAGDLSIASKGQIPTSFIYRSIIRSEAKAASGMTVSVLSMWDIPGAGHLVAYTDTGTNIQPNLKTKLEILRNAVFFMHLLGYEKPQIAVLSGYRDVGGSLPAYQDYKEIRRIANSGELGSCEVVGATSFTDIFLGHGKSLTDTESIDKSKTPHILLVPCLDTGNILCKLDLFLDVRRCSISATSRGPVAIPARSDLKPAIIEQIAMCVVVSDRLEKGVN